MLFDKQSEGIVVACSTQGATPVELFCVERTGMFLLQAELASHLPLLPVIYIPF